MITIDNITANTGDFPLGNVTPMGVGKMLIQTRLLSGSGLTWGVALRGTGSGATPERAQSVNKLTQAAVTAATAITPTAAIQLHEIDCGGCDVFIRILGNTTNGVMEVRAWPLTQGA